MVYVEFPDFYRSPQYGRDPGRYDGVNLMFGEIVTWLNENCGPQYENWHWLTGNLHAQGVYVPTEEDAVAFKLRFAL
jgi:hypothetical protein